MLAVNVRESTTTTGTGDITLDGSIEDGRTFTSQFPINIPIHYFIDDRAGSFEHGIGHLSGSSTLVRDYVIRSSNSDGLVNLASGTKYVFCSSSDTSLVIPDGLVSVGNLEDIYYGAQYTSPATSYTERANQMWLSAIQNQSPREFSKWAVYVKTASAGTSIRAAIYNIDYTTGLPVGDPLMESDNISAGATGLVTLDFSNNVSGIATPTRLPNYFFLGLAFENATISTTAATYTTNGKSWLGGDSNGRGRSIYQGFTMGTPTTGVSVMPTIGSLSERSENYPVMGWS